MNQHQLAKRLRLIQARIAKIREERITLSDPNHRFLQLDNLKYEESAIISALKTLETDDDQSS